jgi:hypothetical protein
MQRGMDQYRLTNSEALETRNFSARKVFKQQVALEFKTLLPFSYNLQDLRTS